MDYDTLIASLPPELKAALRARAKRKRKSPGDDRKPTEVFDEFWLRVQRRDRGSHPEATARSGKWLLFFTVETIDEWWLKIKRATEAGLLGDAAKVATMKPNPNATNESKVICVYTYDADDAADCSRVRDALRDLGVTWKIPYKTDSATYSGKYSWNSTRVSSRYE
jgi:hypothetical protein